MARRQSHHHAERVSSPAGNRLIAAGSETGTSLRAGWQRGTPALAVDPARLDDLVGSMFPGSRLVDTAALSGGLANTNLRLDLDGDPGRVVLRLYQRDPGEMMKEAAIVARLDGKVPLARFLHVETDPALLGAPFAVLGWVDGVTLDSVLPDLAPGDLARLGEDLGRVLAVIHGETFSAAGFFDAELNVAHPIDVGGTGLVAFCRQQLDDGLVLGRLGEDRARGLMAAVEAKAGLLDAWSGPPSLTHSDFNGSNVMVRPRGGEVEIAAVLDWEFAFAGSPFFDLGNITRPPLGDDAGFMDTLARGYREIDDRLPANWPELARLADLTAWIDFATRPDLTPSVLADVLAMIDRTIG